MKRKNVFILSSHSLQVLLTAENIERKQKTERLMIRHAASGTDFFRKENAETKEMIKFGKIRVTLY